MKTIHMSIFALLAIILTSAAPQLAQAGCGYNSGDKVEVLWKGKYYQSTILSCSAASCRIHYDGWSAKWDEDASCDRIKGSKPAYTVGEAVQIKWKGKWWSGKIKGLKGSLYCITYDGYGSEWDECLGTDRLKKK